MPRSALVLLLGVLTGCSFAPHAPAPAPAPTTTVGGTSAPAPEPRSRYGNPASYTEFGRRYVVMDSAKGYRERGIASWYGKKFHGRRTSSGEPYDMYALSAAHKTLPLPTWVEVRNLKNNRTLVLRVNDRGPFVANRIIDLSYAAATELDIVRDGTGLVEVTALSFAPNGDALAPPPEPVRAATVIRHAEPTPSTEPAPADAAETPPPLSEPATAPVQTAAATAPNSVAGSRLFAQVGAFASLDNAEAMFIRLRETGFGPVDIVTRAGESPTLYRVRVGPMADTDTLDETVNRLNASGLGETQVIIE